MPQRARRPSTCRASRCPPARASGWSCRSSWSRSSWAARPTSPTRRRRSVAARGLPAQRRLRLPPPLSRSTSRDPACAASSRRRSTSRSRRARSTRPTTEDEELRSPYVDDDELDIGRWAHDATMLALPTRFLCRPECAGLCAVCGESLNDADPADHEHEQATRPPLGGPERPQARVGGRTGRPAGFVPLWETNPPEAMSSLPVLPRGSTAWWRNANSGPWGSVAIRHRSDVAGSACIACIRASTRSDIPV